jgi:multicomponent Na+:H+ antiporter subunit A
VDFRAFDTLGEISVVAMAALSVLTLVAMRERGETQ